MTSAPRPVTDAPPESRGHDFLRAVVDVVAEIHGNGNLGFQQRVVLVGADFRRSARFNRHNRGDIVNGSDPADAPALGVGDINGFASGHVPHFLQNRAQRFSEQRLVIGTRVGRHLTEELILRLVAFGELRTLVAFRGHKANAEMRIPRLFAGLIVSRALPDIQHIGRHLRGRARLAAPGLVHQKRRVAHLQEQVRPAGPPVRGGHPACAGLSVAVEIYDRAPVIVRWNLVEDAGMVNMGGRTR